MKLKKNTPNFFIVGAPKCGTTALDYHLDLHPDVFMAKKELHYFGSDLGIIQPELTEDKYLSFFNNAQHHQLKGESSVWYLYSKTAAKEIKAFNPSAKIIILLRNPIDLLVSLHNQHVFNGIEKINDINQAISEDMDRITPYPCSLFKNRPKYMNTVLFYQHVKRYLTIFNKENVLIIFQEDLKNEFNTTLKKVFSFLSVENDVEIEKKLINQRKEIKNIALYYLSKNPPSNLKNIIRLIIPSQKIRHQLMQTIDDINISKSKKHKELNSELKNKIIKIVKPDIQQLEQFINKDLSHWSR